MMHFRGWALIFEHGPRASVQNPATSGDFYRSSVPDVAQNLPHSFFRFWGSLQTTQAPFVPSRIVIIVKPGQT